MKNIFCRRWYLVACILSFSVFFLSLYFQYFRGLQPCPLCIMQRLCAIILGIIALIAAVNFPKFGKKNLVSIVVIAGFGIYFALRQLWLQALPPDQMPACLPGLDIMLHYLPWKDIFHALLWGAADCAEVNWQFLGLSMPAWSLIYFLLIAFGCFWAYRSSDFEERKS